MTNISRDLHLTLLSLLYVPTRGCDMPATQRMPAHWAHITTKNTHTSLVPRHVCQESAHTNETSRPNTEASSPVWFHSYAVTRRTHARPRWNVFSAAAASADVSFESRPPLEGRSAGAPQPLSSKLTPPMNYKTNRNNPCIKSRLYAAPSGETEQTVAVSAYTQSSCWGLRPI